MTLARVEPIRADAEPPCRTRQQLRPSERRGAAEGRSLLLGGVAAECAEVVWHSIGLAHDDPDPLDRDIELVGHDLCEAGADALTELDLSRERGDRSVGRDRDAFLEMLERHQPAARCTARIARP